MLYRRTKVYKGRGRLKFYFSSMTILEYNLIACLFRDVIYIGIEYERRVTCIYYLYIYAVFNNAYNEKQVRRNAFIIIPCSKRHIH